MKVLLRSTYLADHKDDEDLCKQNFMELRGSGLGFEIAEDSKIWEYIVYFIDTHGHEGRTKIVWLD